MENFVRLLFLLREVAVGVIQTFLESKIGPHSFDMFLQQHIHDLFHLCNTIRCCSCGLSPTFPSRAVIIKAQLDKLFVQQAGVNCPSNSRFCCCSYIATPNIQIDTIDITMCIAIIKNLITLNQQQNDCLTEIRNVRNKISHFAHKDDIDSAEFYRMWGIVTNASIHLATYINHRYSADIQDKIERLRTRPILAVEYTEALRQIVIWMKQNDENREEIDERLKRIETKIDEMTFKEARGPASPLKCQQTINERECELPYATETQSKIVKEIKRNMVCVYRLLRPDEIYANVIQAKNPNSLTSVFRHVTGGGWGPTSRYISTCGSLQALRDFASRSMRSPADIIKIKIDTLPENVEIIISETTPKG